jgi:DNA-binding CsgD family transcriptional regulator
MLYHLSIHRPKPEDERDLIDPMHRWRRWSRRTISTRGRPPRPSCSCSTTREDLPLDATCRSPDNAAAEGGPMVREVLGRADDLTLTSQLLERVPSGPVAIVIGGDEGIGKTTLWAAVLSQAEERRYRVISARPVESEAKLAFAAVADLLRDGLDEALLALPSPQRMALEAALLRVDLEGSPDPKAVAFGIFGSLRALAASGPLVIGVDDVEWLDAPSARVLEFALRRLEDAPVGVVVASRAARSGPSPLGLDKAPLEERTRRITLEPLGLDVLRQILRSKLDVRFPRWVLQQLQEASGGNPLLTLELARALIRRGIDPEPGEALPIPEPLAELMTERLAVLSGSVRGMLLLVAASPRATLPSISEALRELGGSDEDLDAAIAADVIEISRERIRFTNPLLGTVLYAETSPADRRRAHRVLAGAASDPEERARHLALAAEGPDAHLAQLLEDAAQRARSHGAPDAAAELAELARVLTPEDGEGARVRRTAHAGRYAFESAQIERAEELLQEAASASTGPMRAETLLYLSRVHYHRRDAPSAAALAEQALREASGDPSLEASINLELATAAELSGDHKTATARARRALQLAERSGDRTITAESLAVVGLYDFVSGKGVPTDKIARAISLGAGPPLRPLRSPDFYEACILMWSDDLPRARDRLRELEGRARDNADESSLSILLFLLSQIDSWMGHLDEAARSAAEGRSVAEWTGQQAYLAFALYALALVESVRGNVEPALAFGEQSLASARLTGSAQAEEFARSVLGFLELSRGDARAAHERLAPLVASLDARGPADPGTLRFLPDEAEALIELGEVDDAEALLRPFEASAEELGRTWAQGAAARCRGLLLASRRDLAGALVAFDAAERHQRDLGQPLELGRTYLAKGKALRRGKQWASSREALNQALRICDGIGASLWAERTRSELGRIGGRTQGLNTLTETENQVAELAASGLTNREVAARLFLSVSTVESNLRKTYRKLGIRSRAELSNKLARFRSREGTQR